MYPICANEKAARAKGLRVVSALRVEKGALKKSIEKFSGRMGEKPSAWKRSVVDKMPTERAVAAKEG